MQSDIAAERFLVAAENRTYGEIFFMIADAFGKKDPTKKYHLYGCCGLAGRENQEFIFRKRSDDHKRNSQTSLALVRVDNQKLLTALPAFKYQPIQQSIERICAALQQR